MRTPNETKLDNKIVNAALAGMSNSAIMMRFSCKYISVREALDNMRIDTGLVVPTRLGLGSVAWRGVRKWGKK